MELILDDEFRRGGDGWSEVEETRRLGAPWQAGELVRSGDNESWPLRVDVLVDDVDGESLLERALRLPAPDEKATLHVSDPVVAVVERRTAPGTRVDLNRVALAELLAR